MGNRGKSKFTNGMSHGLGTGILVGGRVDSQGCGISFLVRRVYTAVEQHSGKRW